MTRPYAEVIGDPISHSKSPLIHNFWLAKLGIDAEYRACHVRPDELADYFARKREDAKWLGCNVTAPHKVAVTSILDTITSTAHRVGAVNCAYRQERQLIGGNSDVEGVLASLPPKVLWEGSHVCLLGIGGAARAALVACDVRNVDIVYLSARDQDAAWSLIEKLGFAGGVTPFDFVVDDIVRADVIINATPLGMTGKEEMPAAILTSFSDARNNATVFDMVYSPLETKFLASARHSRLHTVDGLQMLVGQAAAAFELFFSKPAPRQHDTELRALLTA
jgi:shikimate dehydrogenase